MKNIIQKYRFFLVEEEKPALPLLSESLVLDNLWETLSACLLELEHTPDHHAVLVLQVKYSLKNNVTTIILLSRRSGL